MWEGPKFSSESDSGFVLATQTMGNQSSKFHVSLPRKTLKVGSFIGCIIGILHCPVNDQDKLLAFMELAFWWAQDRE